MKNIILVVMMMVTGLSGCGGGGGSTAASTTPAHISSAAVVNAEAIASFGVVYTKWKDALTLAKSTPRISLATPISGMQTIKQDATVLTAPACLSNSKKLLLDGMNLSISGYLDFMAQGALSPYYIPAGVRLLSQYEKNVASSCSYVAGGSGALTISTPFTSAIGITEGTPSLKAGSNEIESTYYNYWYSATGDTIFLQYIASVFGDKMAFDVGSSSTNLWAGTDATPSYCSIDGLLTSLPNCSTWGVSINRASGSISFVNTPVTENSSVSPYTATGKSGTMTGTLNFVPF